MYFFGVLKQIVGRFRYKQVEAVLLLSEKRDSDGGKGIARQEIASTQLIRTCRKEVDNMGARGGWGGVAYMLLQQETASTQHNFIQICRTEVYMQTDIRTYIHTYTHTHTHTHPSMYCRYVYDCIYKHIHTHACYAHAYAYIHTYIHIILLTLHDVTLHYIHEHNTIIAQLN